MYVQILHFLALHSVQSLQKSFKFKFNLSASICNDVFGCVLLKASHLLLCNEFSYF